MPSCVIKLCRNHSRQESQKHTITFHLFPTDPCLADRWIKVVRKSRNEDWWKPNTRSTICSAHFYSKDKYLTKRGRTKIKHGAIPSREHLDSKQVRASMDDTHAVVTSNISEILDDSLTSCGEENEKNLASSFAGNEDLYVGPSASDYTVNLLQSKIKKQNEHIATYLRKIKSLTNKNRRYQQKLKNIEVVLGPILQKISALKDVNLQAQAMIQRQLKNKSSEEL